MSCEWRQTLGFPLPSWLLLSLSFQNNGKRLYTRIHYFITRLSIGYQPLLIFSIFYLYISCLAHLWDIRVHSTRFFFRLKIASVDVVEFPIGSWNDKRIISAFSGRKCNLLLIIRAWTITMCVHCTCIVHTLHAGAASVYLAPGIDPKRYSTSLDSNDWFGID